MHYEREDACRAWLTYAHAAPHRLADLLTQLGSAEAVYERFVGGRKDSLREWLTERQIGRLQAHSSPKAMHDMLVVMRDRGIGILGLEDFQYPDALRNIPRPPAPLFYQGNPDAANNRCLTIIGSRLASAETLVVTERIARELSENGVCVVSGLAPGVDTAAHEGALQGGTPCAGFLACGLAVDYPAVSRGLKWRIIEAGGLLMSEYSPEEVAGKGHFPDRNRLVSGLSRATILMEGQIRSGSMTTVDHALDQGREVFAYPGVPDSPRFEAAHQLLRDGARYFTTAEDILEDMGWTDDKPVSAAQKADLPPMSPEEHLLMTALQDGTKTLDELLAATGLEVSAANASLTMLQLTGLIRALPGKCFCLA